MRKNIKNLVFALTAVLFFGVASVTFSQKAIASELPTEPTETVEETTAPDEYEPMPCHDDGDNEGCG